MYGMFKFKIFVGKKIEYNILLILSTNINVNLLQEPI